MRRVAAIQKGRLKLTLLLSLYLKKNILKLYYRLNKKRLLIKRRFLLFSKNKFTYKHYILL